MQYLFVNKGKKNCNFLWSLLFTSSNWRNSNVEESIGKFINNVLRTEIAGSPPSNLPGSCHLLPIFLVESVVIQQPTASSIWFSFSCFPTKTKYLEECGSPYMKGVGGLVYYDLYY